MTNPTDAINAYIAGNRIGSLNLSEDANAQFGPWSWQYSLCEPTQPSQIDAINASVQAELLQQPQSALVISGRLTSVGETFATIITGTRTLADQLAGVASQQVTLGISTEQARWLGRYVGGQIKLTVEVVL